MTSKEYKKQKRISNRMKRKLALMFVVIVLALVGLSVRIVYINETNGDKYTKKVLLHQKNIQMAITYVFTDVPAM